MDFKACPLLYRFRVVERAAETPSPAAVRGTLVHAVLERLFDLPETERTPAAAVRLLPQVWAELQAEDELDGFDDPPDEGAWLTSAEALLDTYFRLEDPRRYQPSARELPVEVAISAGLLLRGIIDRVDEAADGRIRVVDYKTGRSPAPGYESRALFQLRFYALVLWRTTGVLPSILRLMYLGDGVILEHAPTEDELLSTQRLLLALHEAIVTAHESGEFQPSPGAACRWCSFIDRCPTGRASRPATVRLDEPSGPAPGQDGEPADDVTLDQNRIPA